MQRMDRQRERQMRRQGARGFQEQMRNQQSRFREDLGFSMTPQEYEGYLANQEQYSTEMGRVSGELEGYEGKLGEYEKQLTGVEAELNKAFQMNKGADPEGVWNKFEKGFIDLQVMSDGNLEKVYRLPKEAVESLHTGAFNQGDGSYVGNWKGDGKYYQVDTKMQGGESYGKELHDAMSTAQSTIKDTFFQGQKTKVEGSGITPKNLYAHMQEKMKGVDPNSPEYDDLYNQYYTEYMSEDQNEYTRGRSTASMIDERQKEAQKLLMKQRDILTGKRADLMSNRSMLEGKRDELSNYEKLRQQQFELARKKQEEGKKARSKMFALRGK